MITKSSRTLVSVSAAIAIAIASIGCGDPPVTTAPSGSAAKPAGSVATPAKPSAKAPASAAAAPTEAPASDEILTEADFEEEAEKDISADNMDAELAKLEKEIEEAK